MKEKKNTFLDAAVILFFLTFVNKLLGFVKSMTIASIYGATIQTDAYYVAEGLMQNVLISISEALAVSFLPIYISIREKDKEDSKGFTSRNDDRMYSYWQFLYRLYCIFQHRYYFASCFRHTHWKKHS